MMTILFALQCEEDIRQFDEQPFRQETTAHIGKKGNETADKCAKEAKKRKEH